MVAADPAPAVHLVVVLFFVTLFVALLTAMLPGDPVDAIAGFEARAEGRAAQDLGLDDPVSCSTGAGSATSSPATSGLLQRDGRATGHGPVRDSLPSRCSSWCMRRCWR